MYTLLIVDDEQIEREALNFVVQREFQDIQVVDVAVSGRDAIGKVKQYYPDILFMDIKMPGINGLEAAKQIKEFHQECKIIFMSAFDYFHYAQQAVKVGAMDFILKPLSDEQVVESLTRAIHEIDKVSVANQLDERENRGSLQIDKTAALIEKTCDYIGENYAQEITLKEMAAMAGYTNHYYSKMFKLYKKQNFIDYVTSIRVEKAKELLLHSYLSIKEVSVIVGYGDQNYFTRVFKKIENMTPTEYKDKIVLKN